MLRREILGVLSTIVLVFGVQGCSSSGEDGASVTLPLIPTQTNQMFSSSSGTSDDSESSSDGLSESGASATSESGDGSESSENLAGTEGSNSSAGLFDDISDDDGSSSTVVEVVEDMSGSSTTTTVVTTTSTTTSSSTGDMVDTSADGLGAGRDVSIGSSGRTNHVSKAFGDLVEEANTLTVKASSSLEVGRATSLEASQSAVSAMSSLATILSSLPNLQTLQDAAIAAQESFAATQLENASHSFERAKVANDIASVSLTVTQAEEAVAHALSLSSPSTSEEASNFEDALDEALASLEGVSKEAGNRAASAKSAADLITSAMSRLNSAAGSVSGTLRDDIILFAAKTDVPHDSLVNSKDTWGTAQVHIDLAKSQLENAKTKIRAAISRRRLSFLI